MFNWVSAATTVLKKEQRNGVQTEIAWLQKISICGSGGGGRSNFSSAVIGGSIGR